MDKAITSFLAGIVDYAGLFPPAELPMDKAMAEYIKYRHSDYDWMLSRFIISSEQFNDLRNFSNSDQQLPDPLRLSITAPAPGSVEQYIDELEKIENNILQLHKDIPEKLQTNILELKLPNKIFSASGDADILNLIDHTVQSVCKHTELPYQVFFEIPGTDFNINYAEKAINAISAHNQSIEKDDLEHYKFSGFKIRCGGVGAHQFPPSDYLAEAIAFARDAGTPLKFTAGLHHPVKLFHASVQTKMYGFFNVFGAGLFANTHSLNTTQLMEILDDENSDNFTFSNNHFAWKDFKISQSEIQKLRKEALISFGSCSMAEPVEDLQNLGLIE